MSEAITTARPYAQAAFDEAQKLNDAARHGRRCCCLWPRRSIYPEMIAVITNPRVAKKQVEGLMEALLGKGATKQQQNFVHIAGRQSAFAAVARNRCVCSKR